MSAADTGDTVTSKAHTPQCREAIFQLAAQPRRQELHNKTAHQPSRRLDVDAKGLDGQAAKDFLTLEEFRRVQNFTADKCNNSWLPGAKLAETILK